jgi:chromate transport protein ChrA
VPRIRKSKTAGAFLDGVNVASLALMAAVTWQLGRASLVDTATVLFAVASLIALLRFRVNSAWLVLFGATIGPHSNCASPTIETCGYDLSNKTVQGLFTPRALLLLATGCH